jgi:hypothetical protein
MQLQRIKRLVVGRPLATGCASETLLPKWLALPIFSSDAPSSVAYATEAALAASAGASEALLPISAAIVALLSLVVLSCRQTVPAYPSGGGAYVVASENLGRPAGLLAGASLLVDCSGRRCARHSRFCAGSRGSTRAASASTAPPSWSADGRPSAPRFRCRPGWGWVTVRPFRAAAALSHFGGA